MIIKYDENKRKLKKPIDFDLQDALKIDAKIFLNNLQIISDKKIKRKQKNYAKPAGMYISSKIEIQQDLKERLNNIYEKYEDTALKNQIEKILNFLKESDNYEGL